MLKWVVSDLKDEVVMLDLQVKLQNVRLKAQKNQKGLNLYTYVLRHSAYPPSFLCVLIISQLS